MTSEFLSPDLLAQMVERTVLTAPVYDIHTHLYAPTFGNLLLWGIDDLLVYHYPVGKASGIGICRARIQADLIWTAPSTLHALGQSRLSAYVRLFAAFPKNRLLLAVLSRENQNELCVLARKFRDLPIFGWWWLTNIPSVIDEMTRIRLGLLGLSMTAQHLDARVLDQLIYKWSHSPRVIADVLKDKYRDLAATGWGITTPEIQRDVETLFGGLFEAFLKRSL